MLNPAAQLFVTTLMVGAVKEGLSYPPSRSQPGTRQKNFAHSPCSRSTFRLENIQAEVKVANQSRRGNGALSICVHPRPYIWPSSRSCIRLDAPLRLRSGLKWVSSRRIVVVASLFPLFINNLTLLFSNFSSPITGLSLGSCLLPFSSLGSIQKIS
ncbi:hypothetical protein F4778DRAFT_321053 [Xylariomycetidae sp. FL2044]|nr:hypothetical protein F4778DRAFT_321053 [Xylariomycetidae sp. FL2044]